MYLYRPRNVCSQAISIELEGDVIKSVDFLGGCQGNLKAISKVVEGMTVDHVAELWEGNTCGRRLTSCADQLVQGLRAAQAAGEGAADEGAVAAGNAVGEDAV